MLVLLGFWQALARLMLVMLGYCPLCCSAIATLGAADARDARLLSQLMFVLLCLFEALALLLLLC